MLKRAKIRVVTCVFCSTPRVLLLPAAGLVWFGWTRPVRATLWCAPACACVPLSCHLFFYPRTTTAGAGHHHHHLARRNTDKIGKSHM